MEMVGKKFGRLVVTGFSHSDDGRYWHCQCECGGKTISPTAPLNSGSTRSCGCLLAEARKKNLRPGHNKTHGLSHTKIHYVYDNMVKRCYTKTNKRYDRYGGRGIKVCDEWLSSRSAFFEWALANGYKETLTIDRENNDGNYSPENCRFVTHKVQANNTSRNHHLTFNGKTLTLSQWEEEVGINQNRIRQRIARGWSIKDALTKPLRVW